MVQHCHGNRKTYCNFSQQAIINVILYLRKCSVVVFQMACQCCDLKVKSIFMIWYDGYDSCRELMEKREKKVQREQ